MNKIVDVVFVVLGIISIIGAAALLYGIGVVDNAMNEVLSQTEAVPLDPASVQQLAGQFKGILTLGRIWAAVVMAASLALIYLAVADIRRQRSIVVRKK